MYITYCFRRAVSSIQTHLTFSLFKRTLKFTCCMGNNNKIHTYIVVAFLKQKRFDADWVFSSGKTKYGGNKIQKVKYFAGVLSQSAPSSGGRGYCSATKTLQNQLNSFRFEILTNDTLSLMYTIVSYLFLYDTETRVHTKSQCCESIIYPLDGSRSPRFRSFSEFF